ncbi:MCE family protein [Nocardioides sp. Bht2]|uniref:MCE family protein n=1 Tax=Nocardioides sp. Bht2 TaxID=3392297 RepID=UPI0039B65534
MSATATMLSQRTRMLLAGLLTLALLGGVTVWLAGSYAGLITNDLKLTAALPTSGDSLGVSSDVKYRGLRVGRVLSVEPGSRPSAQIVLMSEYADEIPGDVVARVLPGTLFGNEYVDLVRTEKATGAPGTLRAGGRIPADTSRRTVRLMDTFTAAQRLLVAIDPADLDAALSQLAASLEGRGDDLGAFISDAGTMLDSWQKVAPTFHRDLALLADASELGAELEPVLVQILRDSLPLARTYAEQHTEILAALRDLSDLAGTVDTFLRSYRTPLGALLANLADVLSTMAGRSGSFTQALAEFTGVVENGANAIKGGSIQMEGVVGGQLPAPYGPADCPRYGSMAGRNCR